MGSLLSTSNNNNNNKEYDNAHKIASQRYNERLQNYNYAIHGPYTYYIQNIYSEFQLECIPKDALQGYTGSKMTKFNG